MAEIRRYPFVRHLRAEPTSHVLRYRSGRLVQRGRGVSFWFRPLRTAVVEIPVDDRELQFLFHGRSADFQEIAVQGALVYRVLDPERLADRIDFTVDLARGRYLKTPLEQLANLLTQVAQGFVWGYLVATPLETLLTTGVREIDRRLTEGFAADPRLADLGCAITVVNVLAVTPAREVERALQVPELEKVQQLADKATFERRAAAVEQERAISENELQNRIELSRREEELVVQESVNARRRAESEAETSQIEARSEAARIEAIETARAAGERAQVDVYRELPVGVSQALALRDLARNVPPLERLTITPELLGPALARLAEGGP
jgi:regulator of protease activity HflC (stomatin/prohibitin superfamily)